MMCTPWMPSDSANGRWIADACTGNAARGAVAYSWSPIRATVDEVPILFGDDVNHGAESERLIVKIPPTGRQSHVPVPPLLAGSRRGPGQPGTPLWLQPIAACRPPFSAGVENDCVAASSVVSWM